MLDPIPTTSRQRSHPAIAFKACHGGAQRPTLGARCGSNGDPFEMAIENGTVWPWDGIGPWGSEMFRANFHFVLPQIPSVQKDLVRWCELMIVGKMNCHLGDHLTLQHAVMQWEQYQPLLVMVPVVLPLLSLPQNVDDETIHKDAQSRQKMQHSFWYRITGICMPLPSTTSVLHVLDSSNPWWVSAWVSCVGGRAGRDRKFWWVSAVYVIYKYNDNEQF